MASGLRAASSAASAGRRELRCALGVWGAGSDSGSDPDAPACNTSPSQHCSAPECAFYLHRAPSPSCRWILEWHLPKYLNAFTCKLLCSCCLQLHCRHCQRSFHPLCLKPPVLSMQHMAKQAPWVRSKAVGFGGLCLLGRMQQFWQHVHPVFSTGLPMLPRGQPAEGQVAR